MANYLNNKEFTGQIIRYQQASKKLVWLETHRAAFRNRYRYYKARAEARTALEQARNSLWEMIAILAKNLAATYARGIDVEDAAHTLIVETMPKLACFNPARSNSAFNFFTTCMRNSIKQIQRRQFSYDSLLVKYSERLEQDN
jgi:hypothetical protein